MHPRQASLLTVTNEVTEKLAAKKPVAVGGAPLLWKYVDPDTNQEFFLPERKMTVRSPYTGKSFSTKPEKMTPAGVGKEMRDEAKGGGAPGPKAATPKQTKKKNADWKA